MSFSLKMNLGGCEVLIPLDKIEKLLEIFEGCDVIEAKYVGQNKGWYGASLDYETRMSPFDSTRHMGAATIITQLAVDKYKTLEAMKTGGV